MSSTRIKPKYRPDGWELVVVSPWNKVTVLHRPWRWYLRLIGFIIEVFTSNRTFIRRAYAPI